MFDLDSCFFGGSLTTAAFKFISLIRRFDASTTTGANRKHGLNLCTDAQRFNFVAEVTNIS